LRFLLLLGVHAPLPSSEARARVLQMQRPSSYPHPHWVQLPTCSCYPRAALTPPSPSLAPFLRFTTTPTRAAREGWRRVWTARVPVRQAEQGVLHRRIVGEGVHSMPRRCRHPMQRSAPSSCVPFPFPFPLPFSCSSLVSLSFLSKRRVFLVVWVEDGTLRNRVVPSSVRPLGHQQPTDARITCPTTLPSSRSPLLRLSQAMAAALAMGHAPAPANASAMRDGVGKHATNARLASFSRRLPPS
jgi:hypothetical protein